MFDLSKLNRSLKSGTDRMVRILGKETLKKVEQNAWKTLKSKTADEGTGDSETKLRQTEGQ